MSGTYSLSIAAELGNLDAVRDFVRESTAALGADGRTVASLLLAMDEAATNVVEHGYRGRPGMLEIEIFREAQTVVMCLRDRAPTFDPTSEVAPPDLTSPLEERDPGRLGVYFIRQFMDEVVHRVMPAGGNELVMKKYLA